MPRVNRVPIGLTWLSLLVATSGLSSRDAQHLPCGASRPAALLIAHLCPISSLFAPCGSGAARRNMQHISRGQATSAGASPIQGPRQGATRAADETFVVSGTLVSDDRAPIVGARGM